MSMACEGSIIIYLFAPEFRIRNDGYGVQIPIRAARFGQVQPREAVEDSRQTSSEGNRVHGEAPWGAGEPPGPLRRGAGLVSARHGPPVRRAGGRLAEGMLSGARSRAVSGPGEREADRWRSAGHGVLSHGAPVVSGHGEGSLHAGPADGHPRPFGGGARRQPHLGRVSRLSESGRRCSL